MNIRSAWHCAHSYGAIHWGAKPGGCHVTQRALQRQHHASHQQQNCSALPTPPPWLLVCRHRCRIGAAQKHHVIGTAPTRSSKKQLDYELVIITACTPRL